MSKADWVFQLHGDARGIERRLAEGVNACIFPGEQAMLSVVRVEPNATGSMHSHPQEQWGVMLEGSCTRIQGGEEVEVTVGDFWHTPGGVMHGIRTGDRSAVILDIFSPPRAEYKQKGQGFGKATVKEN